MKLIVIPNGCKKCNSDINNRPANRSATWWCPRCNEARDDKNPVAGETETKVFKFISQVVWKEKVHEPEEYESIEEIPFSEPPGAGHNGEWSR